MISGIDHLGIAVSSLEKGVKLYKNILGLELLEYENVPEQKVKVAIFKSGKGMPNIELLEPTSEESPIYKFIQKKGEGIHHVAFKVENIEELLKNLKEKGARLIDEIPRIGAGGKKIAFLHPKSTQGVLMELCESQKE